MRLGHGSPAPLSRDAGAADTGGAPRGVIGGPVGPFPLSVLMQLGHRLYGERPLMYSKIGRLFRTGELGSSTSFP